MPSTEALKTIVITCLIFVLLLVLHSCVSFVSVSYLMHFGLHDCLRGALRLTQQIQKTLTSL